MIKTSCFSWAKPLFSIHEPIFGDLSFVQGLLQKHRPHTKSSSLLAFWLRYNSIAKWVKALLGVSGWLQEKGAHSGKPSFRRPGESTPCILYICSGIVYFIVALLVVVAEYYYSIYFFLSSSTSGWCWCCCPCWLWWLSLGRANMLCTSEKSRPSLVWPMAFSSSLWKQHILGLTDQNSMFVYYPSYTPAFFQTLFIHIIYLHICTLDKL